MDAEKHWQSVYGDKGPNDVSWYRPHLDRSLHFIDEACLNGSAQILDVGGGASTFVDDRRKRTNQTPDCFVYLCERPSQPLTILLGAPAQRPGPPFFCWDPSCSLADGVRRRAA
jgi:hypothetical protein